MVFKIRNLILFPNSILIKSFICVSSIIIGTYCFCSLVNEVIALPSDLVYIKGIVSEVRSLPINELLQVENFELTFLWDKWMIENLSSKYGTNLSHDDAALFVKWCVLNGHDVSSDVSFSLSSTPGLTSAQ